MSKKELLQYLADSAEYQNNLLYNLAKGEMPGNRTVNPDPPEPPPEKPGT